MFMYIYVMLAIHDFLFENFCILPDLCLERKLKLLLGLLKSQDCHAVNTRNVSLTLTMPNEIRVTAHY